MIINPYIYSNPIDPDAQAFITATGISGTNATATNQLVVDLKAANIWTKMKCIYPFVGGTSAFTHKFNLKDPRDLNAAFRLSFIGGGTFSANGYLPNGTNGYADTFLIPSTALTLNNSHVSYYSRSNILLQQIEMGCSDLTNQIYLACNYQSIGAFSDHYNIGSRVVASQTNSQGLYIGTRTSSTIHKMYKNGSQIGTTNSTAGGSLNIYKLVLGARNVTNVVSAFSSKECAFASIGDGLTDLESQVFYQITEKFQVALGRNINPTQSFYYNTAYNNETNAFLFSTQITNTTIQTATNTLVADLKTAGVYTKMRAIYPMVGGTATTHQYNLINPQNSNAANRVSFNGPWTHSSNGALPGGTGGSHADTYISGLPQNSTHLLYYSRTNASTDSVDMGVTGTNGVTHRLAIRNSNSGGGYAIVNSPASPPAATPITDSRGCFMANRTASNVLKFIKNGVVLTTYTTASTGVPATFTLLLAATTNSSGSVLFSSNKECAFASAGDGLTDAEALALYNAVQLFNTTLGRQV